MFLGSSGFLGFLALMLSASRVLAGIEVNVTRVGFPTVDAGPVYRVGEWTPIVVDIDLLNQPSFDGTIRSGQYDLDGDQAFDSVALHLSAETGGSTRRFLYVLGNPWHGEEEFFVELLDADGRDVEVVSQGVLTYRAEPAQQPTPISDADVLILSISTGAIGRLGELVESGRGTVYYPPVHVAHMSPSDLPALAAGLAAVDYIVWDEADPTDLTQRQRRALIEWVRGGGTLLMAAARTAGLIEESEFGELLPVILGATRSVDNLPTVRRLLIAPPREDVSDILPSESEPLDAEWYLKPYRDPVVVVETRLRPSARVLGAETLPRSSDREERLETPVVSERWVEEGRLIFCAVSLKHLLSGPDYAPAFFEKMFYLVRQPETEAAPPQPISLFGSVTGAIAFSTSSSLYLFLAFLFSVSYVLTATVGTWWYLSRLGRRQHAWSAFAIVAGCAVFLSLGAVGWARGLGERVHQLSVIDFDSGTRFAEGVVFFGVKTALDQELDIWLPSDPSTALEPAPARCAIKPLPPGALPSEIRSGFADPEAYQLAPAIGSIRGVRFRSTLKRLEGRWHGPLKGGVTGRLVMNRDGTLHEDSFIRNDLGVELRECYLLHALLDPFDARRGTLAPIPRDTAILAYPIERVPAGRRVALAPLCNPRPDPRSPGRQTPLPRLQERHAAWSRPLLSRLSLNFGSDGSDFAMGMERNALLIASTVGDFDPASIQGSGFFRYGRWMCTRDRLRSLDLLPRLRRDTAILVGFADDPGPIRLFRRAGSRYRSMEPDPRHSTTMYRIRIPVVWPDDDGADDPGEEPPGRERD